MQEFSCRWKYCWVVFVWMNFLVRLLHSTRRFICVRSFLSSFFQYKIWRVPSEPENATVLGSCQHGVAFLWLATEMSRYTLFPDDSFVLWFCSRVYSSVFRQQNELTLSRTFLSLRNSIALLFRQVFRTNCFHSQK